MVVLTTFPCLTEACSVLSRLRLIDWGLRKYAGEQGVEWPAVDYAPMPGLPEIHIDAMRCELGLEPTPEAYIGHMVLVMREMRRVLRDDGTCFVNLGDSYANNGGGALAWSTPTEQVKKRVSSPDLPAKGISSGLKPKDLIGIPWRFAFAVQADGWWLRSDIIGAKVAPMPESVTDRPTRAHEYIFLLTKSKTYYYDQEAVREPVSDRWPIATNTWDERKARGEPTRRGQEPYSAVGFSPGGFAPNPNGRNLRSVWEWRPQPFPGAHFAVWPEAIPERCILAGTSARGACPTCGAPWQRVVERGEPERIGGNAGVSVAHAEGPMNRNGNGQWDKGHMPMVRSSTTTGWRPTCACFGEFADSAIPQTCVVLDPFHGSGTTGVVALRLGRAYIGVDISEEYLHGVTQERMGAGVQVGMGF